MICRINLLTASKITFFSFSAHIITQRASLDGYSAMVLCFWYSLLGTATSLITSVIFEAPTLPITSADWFLLVGYCLGSAGYTITSTVAQNVASFIVNALSFGATVAFYFVAQFAIFHEISKGGGLYIEVCGAVLTVVSSSLVPVYELIINSFNSNSSGKMDDK